MRNETQGDLEKSCTAMVPGCQISKFSDKWIPMNADELATNAGELVTNVDDLPWQGKWILKILNAVMDDFLGLKYGTIFLIKMYMAKALM